MTATEFKAKCLRVLEEVDSEGVVITKRGRPVALVIRADSADRSKLIGCMKDKIKVKGNLVSPRMRRHGES